jgi:hypothetical protein
MPNPIRSAAERRSAEIATADVAVTTATINPPTRTDMLYVDTMAASTDSTADTFAKDPAARPARGGKARPLNDGKTIERGIE